MCLAWLLVANPFALVACSSQDRTSVGKAPTSPSPSLPGGLPLVEIEESPREPPQVWLMAKSVSGKWSRVQSGVVLTGEWLTPAQRLKPLRQPSQGRPVPWPNVSHLDRRSELSLLISTQTVPRTLNVYMYDSRSKPNGAPRGRALYEVECNFDDLMGRRLPCSVEKDRHGVMLRLDDLVGAEGERRIAVNASWADARLTRSGESVTNWGTWLFVTTDET